MTPSRSRRAALPGPAVLTLAARFVITLVLLVVALELRHELEGMAGGITTGVILHWLPPPVYGERRRPEPPADT